MTASTETTTTTQPKSKKKLVLVGVVLLIAAAAAYFFVLKPAPAEEAPKPGEVLALEPIQMNLAEGNYLRLSLALQLSEEAEEADGSKALDAAIEKFSGVPMAELADEEHRAMLTEELTTEIGELYEGDVIDVYLTEFVMQ